MEVNNTLKDFRSRFESLRASEAERLALATDLIDHNEKLIRSTSLRPGFRDVFLNKNEEGGRYAADELRVRIQQYMKEFGLDANSTDVVVRAYANLRGLGKACFTNGLTKASADLCLFANGFNGRQPLFDFVDVGSGKERADHKVREVFNFFVTIPQCKHVVLGLSHDSGYVPFLEQFAADVSINGRITLLEGYQVSQKIRDLGFKTVGFPSVFASAPASFNRGVSSQGQSTLVGQVSAAVKGGYSSAVVDPSRLGPVFKNEGGLRMDKPLAVDASIVRVFQKTNLCAWLFLKGHCKGDCGRNHAHQPLSPEEQDALWHVTRDGRCHAHRRGKFCNDSTCVYGHAEWSGPYPVTGTAAGDPSHKVW
ncbi:MAG: hypothetical protein Q9170_003504 [Blastenia crenularia]